MIGCQGDRPLQFIKRLFRKVSVAMLALMVTHAALANNVTYFHNDISGSPMVATDETGNLLWKESYKPYGEKLNQTNPDSSNKIGFHGKTFDDNTGLSYRGARYYDPLLGRFMGTDPVDFQEANFHSFNRYAYANNNPHKYVDPDGEYAFLIAPAFYALTALTGALAINSALKGQVLAGDGNLGEGVLSYPISEIGSFAKWNVAYSSEKQGKSPKEASKDTLKPGSFADDSIPARGPGRDFTQDERGSINDIGRETGCHTCGKTDPGTKSGNHIPDHQPANALNPAGAEQRLYPHCLGCSRIQGGQVRGATRKNQ